MPGPYWAAVSPVSIPLVSCNKAADILIQWFEPEELKRVVGGERWWQIRGLDGIDAEWITEREYLDNAKPPAGRKLSVTDQDILRMEHLDTVMVSFEDIPRICIVESNPDCSFMCMEVSYSAYINMVNIILIT